MQLTKAQTKTLLEKAYKKYHQSFRLEEDPVFLVHRYQNPKDIEIAAFISSCLAYGNVKSILGDIDKILTPLGPSPYETVKSKKMEGLFDSFYHRWTTGTDIEILCHWLKEVLIHHHSLESFFKTHTKKTQNLKDNLTSFVTALSSLPVPKELQQQRQKRQRNLNYLIPSPARGSACKRMNLFLRWMVRPKDGIDFGQWKTLKPCELILPVDVHLLKCIRWLGWTHSKTATWKVAQEATEQLKLYCPEDPVRYDYSICHLSMQGRSLKELL